MMNYGMLKLDELKRLLPIKIDKRDKAETKFIKWTLQNDIDEIEKVIKEKEEN